MKTLIAAALLLVFATPALAQKLCEELKAEIDAKLKAKGVQNYTLTIVAEMDVKDQQVVGSCEGGTKRIVYKREK
jgi:hypothetical protein